MTGFNVGLHRREADAAVGFANISWTVLVPLINEQ